MEIILKYINEYMPIVEIFVMATGLIGLIFAGKQLRKNTHAQQDGKAPLLVITEHGDVITTCQIENVGNLLAKNIKADIKIIYEDGQSKKSVNRKLMIPRIEIGKATRIFAYDCMKEIHVEKVIKMDLEIEYESPTNDRKRKCNKRGIKR